MACQVSRGLHLPVSTRRLTVSKLRNSKERIARRVKELNEHIEEKEAEVQRKALEERNLAMRVPGMLKPSQIDDKDEEI